jgi:hypothetical protein
VSTTRLTTAEVLALLAATPPGIAASTRSVWFYAQRMARHERQHLRQFQAIAAALT